jgi:cell division protein FtsI (penicillin-binding protein 3)/stage V sporulation protein D (sporulation-specific penicillin-binding protein)
MRAAFRSRLRLVLALLILGGLLILVRLYFVQVVNGAEYALKADRQYASAAGALYDRGSIYFTRADGTQVSAATLSTGFLAAINPTQLKDPAAAYTAINQAASGTISHAFFDAAATSTSVYVEIVHHIDQAAGAGLAAKKVPGVLVLRERWRTYPAGTLAAQSIGFIAQAANDTELKGRTGLESEYEATLSRDGDSLYKNFFAELFSNIGNVVVNARDARQGDVATTIEPMVEARLAEDLSGVNEKYSSKETGGIIMDAKTGAIYALGTYPTFNLNDLGSADPATLENPLVQNVYEFGSIMKPLTMASGLDSGVITPETTYDDTGCIHVDTATICNYDLKARGVIPMQQILSQSLNVGASWIATKLGPTEFRTYFNNLFGQKTGVDLPAEGSALLSNLKSPRQVEFDNMSFGQGIAITPVQMIRALGSLANGGSMARPHVVSAIDLDSGIPRPLDWSGGTSVFKPETAAEVSRMLTLVVDTKIANGKEKIPTMSVAAKTGTAQLTDGHGGYYKDRYFHSFFGYFPATNPRFVILLYTNDPKGVEYASETLTSTFFDLVHFLIGYYAVPPDRAAA